MADRGPQYRSIHSSIHPFIDSFIHASFCPPSFIRLCWWEKPGCSLSPPALHARPRGLKPLPAVHRGDVIIASLSSGACHRCGGKRRSQLSVCECGAEKSQDGKDREQPRVGRVTGRAWGLDRPREKAFPFSFCRPRTRVRGGVLLVESGGSRVLRGWGVGGSGQKGRQPPAGSLTPAGKGCLPFSATSLLPSRVHVSAVWPALACLQSR